MRAGYAFEVTAEDIFVALGAAGISKSFEECEQILDLIDASDVEDAALHGNDLDEQTEYAHQEVLRQLGEQGVIPGAAAPSLS